MRAATAVTDVLTTWAEVIIRVKTNLTLIMTSTQVVEMSVTTTDNSPPQDNIHPDVQTTLINNTNDINDDDDDKHNSKEVFSPQ